MEDPAHAATARRKLLLGGMAAAATGPIASRFPQPPAIRSWARRVDGGALAVYGHSFGAIPTRSLGAAVSLTRVLNGITP